MKRLMACFKDGAGLRDGASRVSTNRRDALSLRRMNWRWLIRIFLFSNIMMQSSMFFNRGNSKGAHLDTATVIRRIGGMESRLQPARR
jgi:hypothetical protein